MLLTSALSAAVIGGIAGYLTNEWALHIFFQGCRPLRIASSISKNKDTFAADFGNIIQEKLVGDSPITQPHLLFQKLQEVDFSLPLTEMLQALFTESFLQQAQTFAEIPDIEKTVSSFSVILQKYILEILPETSIPLEKLFSAPQIEYLTQQILQILSDTLDKQSFLQKWYAQNEHITLYDILREPQTTLLLESVSNQITDTILQNCAPHASQFTAILQSFDFETRIFSLLEKEREKTLSEILGAANTEVFFQTMQSILQHLTQQAELQNIVTNLIQTCIDSFKQSDLPLDSVLPSAFSEQMEGFLSQKIPSLTPYIQTYLSQKQPDIDHMIDAAIQTVIDKKTSFGLVNRLREIFRKEICAVAKNQNLTQKISAYAAKKLQDKTTVQEIQNVWMQSAKRMTLGEVIQKLENKNILSAEKLSNAFIKQLQNPDSDFTKWVLQRIKTTKLSSYVSETQLHAFAKQANAAICTSLPVYILQSHTAKQKIKQIFQQKLTAYLQKPLCEILPTLQKQETKFAHWFCHSDSIKQKLEKQFQQKIKQFTTTESYQKCKKNWIQNIQSHLSVFQSYLFSQKVSAVFSCLPAKPIAEKVSKWLQQHFLPSFLSQNDVIASCVRNNVAQMEEKKLEKAMQSFMGKEMRPLCILGSFFGAATALGLWALETNGMTVPVPIRLFCFAMIGVCTNALAFYALFRPYHKNFLWKCGFGYIPRNQKRIAKGFGVFVEHTLLPSDRITETLKKEQSENIEKLTEDILQEDGKFFYALLLKNRMVISEKLTAYLTKPDTFEKLSKHLTDPLAAIPIHTILPESLLSALPEQGITWLQQQCVVSSLLQKLQESEATLQDKIPPEQIQHFINTIIQEKISQGLANLQDAATIETLMKEITPQYETWLQHCFQDWISPETLQRTAQKWTEFLLQQITEKTSLQTGLSMLLTAICTEEQTVSTVFHGKIPSFLEKQIEPLCEILCQKAILEIQKHEDTLCRMTCEKLRKSLSLPIRAVLDTDDFSYSVVQELTRKQLPTFLRKEQPALSHLIKQFLQKEIYPISLHSIPSVIQTWEWTPLHLSWNPCIEQFTALFSFLLQEGSKVPFSQYAKVLHLSSAESMTEKILPILQAISTTPRLQTLLHDIIEDMVQNLCNTPLKTLTAQIPESLLQDCIQNDFQFFQKNILQTDEMQQLLADMLQKLSETNLSMWIDIPQMQQDILQILKKIPAETIQKHVKTFVRMLCQDKLHCISPATKQYFAHFFIANSYAAVITYLPILMERLSLSEIVEQAVQQMSAKEIHDMFYDFAGTYFHRLEGFGAIGIVFGFPETHRFAMTLTIAALYFVCNTISNRTSQK